MTELDALQLCFGTNYTNFGDNALRAFHFQQKNNNIYENYLRLLGKNPQNVTNWEHIPFLPVSFFKNHSVKSYTTNPEKVFLSSSTTGTGQSRHEVKSLSLYERSFLETFRHFYGDPSDYLILGLLPSYLERGDSSLVYMVSSLISHSKDPQSGFFLYNHEELAKTILTAIQKNKKILLIGVSFALLDLADRYTFPPNSMIVMETGGMKGKRKELTRSELHSYLSSRLGVTHIHSEYGMTELLSQGYSKERGRFECPPWMKVVIKPADDPFGGNMIGKRGRIAVIDLANIYSCSFIETEDVGISYPDGTFDVLGRLDFSETRGCNVMVL